MHTLSNTASRELESLLDSSRATESFKDAVHSYFANKPTDRILLERPAPQAKVRRVLAQLLSTEPHLPIERIVIRAQSGCADFVGGIRVQTATETRTYFFTWCCRWRAEQEGWFDDFGFVDQGRAAQEFDWRCFQRWELLV